MTPAVHRSGLSGMQVVAHRQQQAPVTFIDLYALGGNGSGSWPSSNAAAFDATYFISNTLTQGMGATQVMSVDFGTAKFIQSVNLKGVNAQDAYGAGDGHSGYSFFLYDDTGLLFGGALYGTYQAATGEISVSRNSRFLVVAAQARTGAGGDPFGAHDILFYLDQIDVTAEP